MSNNTLEALIEALTIFKKYLDDTYPTHCEHDIMMITLREQDVVSKEDTKRLDELGFNWSNEFECWISHRFGSC